MQTITDETQTKEVGPLEQAQLDDAAQAQLDERTEALVEKAREAGRILDLSERMAARAAVIAEACGVNPQTEEPYCTTQDVLGWVSRAVGMGATSIVRDTNGTRPATSRVRRASSGGRHPFGPATVRKLCTCEVVPNAPLREEALRQEAQDRGDFWHRLSRAVGRTSTDTTAVKRLLGVDPWSGRPGAPPTVSLFIDHQPAAAIARELDLPYQTVGL